MKKLFPLVIVINLLLCPAFAQNKVIDSLQAELTKTTDDTTRLKIYLALGQVCNVKDNLKYAQPALKLADKLIAHTFQNNKKNEFLNQKAEVCIFFSNYYFYINDTAKIAEWQQKLISIYKETKDTNSIVDTYLGYSSYFKSIGNFPKSLDWSKKGLSVSTEMNYKKGISRALCYIGDIYRDQGEKGQALQNYTKALNLLYELNDTTLLVDALLATGGLFRTPQYYNRALALCEAKKMNDKVSYIYRFLGQIYREHKIYDTSLINYQKSASLFEAMKNKEMVKDILDDIGLVYEEKGDLEKALDYHLKALKSAKELNYEYGIASSYLCLARTYNKQKNYKLAKDYSDRALKMKNQFNIETNRNAELTASQIDSAGGNKNEAFEHYKQYILLRDKMQSEEIHKAAAQEKFQNEFDKQQTIAKSEQEKIKAVANAESKKQKLILLFVVLGLMLVLVFAGFVFRSLQIRNKQNKIITSQKAEVEKEKQRSDELLLNILPEEVAEELKQKGSAEAKQFDNVTVLFTDFVGFTLISEKLTPKELVAEIHYYFTEFDKITERNGLEKIKTVGDAYLAICGLPNEDKYHAKKTVQAALEIIEFINRRAAEGGKFNIRIGINSGSVVAGIVGVKKFAYDIWGDTVNTAARMEQNSQNGKINISESTYQLVKNDFKCVHRGKIEAKNKGEIDMYFVEK